MDFNGFHVVSRLDLEDRIADKADKRLQKLQKVMGELDRQARGHVPHFRSRFRIQNIRKNSSRPRLHA